MGKFKVGDRVRIVTCRVHRETCRHTEVFSGRVSTVVKVNTFGEYILAGDEDSNWHDDELELITTKGGDMNKPNQRRTFKQLKDMATSRRGALWQEACDDGPQEYDLITPEFELDHKHDSTRSIWDRALVEDNPKWFVEVFPVEPQFMTREELDQWETFKSRKKPGRKAKLELTKDKSWSELSPRKKRGESKRRSDAMKASWARRKQDEAAKGLADAHI